MGIRQLGNHIIRLRLDFLIAIKLARHLPSILAVVKGRRIGHMVGAVHFGLDGEQILGIANVALQVLRHVATILKETGQHTSIGDDDRIVRVEHIKIY